MLLRVTFAHPMRPPIAMLEFRKRIGNRRALALGGEALGTGCGLSMSAARPHVSVVECASRLGQTIRDDLVTAIVKCLNRCLDDGIDAILVTFQRQEWRADIRWNPARFEQLAVWREIDLVGKTELPSIRQRTMELV